MSGDQLSGLKTRQLVDAFDYRLKPTVKLTRYAPLSASQLALDLQTDSLTGCSSLNQLLSIDAPDVRQRRWPRRATDLRQSNVPFYEAGRNQSAIALLDVRDSFQVVWRRLSFEVKPNAYERFMGIFIERLAGLLMPSRMIFSSGVNCKQTRDSMISRDANFENNSSNRVIFENLNGHINSGEITGILGPSGSGKTSLLNAICGRVNNYRGSVQLHGGGNRRMRLSIIPQKDYLIGNLSVRENLLYSSKILNVDKKFNHTENIMRVVKMLNLSNCLDSNAANISGGEYKRVSIGQELLSQPDILILDEPTSGLDSLNCKNLIKSLVQLKEASRRGSLNDIAIVMTIHQPDLDTFQLFDHVYCIARHGRVVFEGPPRDVMDVIRSQAGLTNEQLPEGQMGLNPANLLIEIASEDVYGPTPVERLARYQRKQFEMQHFSFDQIIRNQSMEDQFAVCVSDQTINRTTMAESQPGSPSWRTKPGLEYRGQQHSLQKALNKSVRMQSSPISSHTSTTNSTRSLSNSSTLTSGDSRHKANHQLVRDKRLNAKNDLSGLFFYHMVLLSKRAFLSTIRDPLLTIVSLLYHLFLPFVLWTVYSPEIGRVKACPVLQREMEVISLISNTTMNKMASLQEEYGLALECSTMFFLSTYSFSVCSLSIAALAFPLNMHILLKEVRNGWYSLPSYVMAKTIANFPFEVIFPVLSLVMIYLMLGMPQSEMEWRLWSIALVMALISMISHSQGLIFGAICMDSVQTAIFLASSFTLPQTLLSGFTARIKNMPIILQRLSWLSLYRYSTDAINIIRFGFGICPCESSTNEYLRKEPSFSDIPPIMRSLFSFQMTNGAFDVDNSQNDSKSLIQIPGVSYDLLLNATERSQLIRKVQANEIDVFDRMAELMTRSFTYGLPIDNCDSFRSQLLTFAGTPKDDFLPHLFLGMLILLLVGKLILFVVVKIKIGKRI